MNLSDLVAKHCLCGPEKRCTKCLEWWPADEEFFTRRKDTGGLRSWCIACCREACAARDQARKQGMAA